MVQLSTLAKIGVVGFVITSATGVLVVKRTQEYYRATKTYKDALEKFYNHKIAVEHLGPPIHEGKITAYYDYEEGDNTRRFDVNLRGSKTNGKLNCEFLIDELTKTTDITKLEIKFNDVPNKIFVIYESLTGQ